MTQASAVQAAASLAGLAMVALLDGHGRVSYSMGMRVARATVSEKGQVVIPKALRDRLGIRPGQELEFSDERGKLVVRKVAAQDPLDRAYGVLKLKRSVDGTLRALRGEADAAPP